MKQTGKEERLSHHGSDCQHIRLDPMKRALNRQDLPRFYQFKHISAFTLDWSPDGKFLSLTLFQDGNAEIYILNLRNKNLTRLTNHYSIDTESSWSPKGSKIIFTSGRSGSPQIYELNLKRSNSKPKRLTFDGNYNAKGSYLPDNDGIIFVHRENSNFQIAIK